MKRLFLCLFSLLVLASFSYAQDSRRLDVYFNTGLSIPGVRNGGYFYDSWNPGINFGVGMGININPITTFMMMVEYNRFEFDQNGMARSRVRGLWSSISGGPTTIVSLSTNAKFFLTADRSSLSPYVCTGVYYAYINMSNATVIPGSPPYPFAISTDDAPPEKLESGGFLIRGAESSSSMFQLGAGLDIPADDNVNLFVEAKYGVLIAKGGNFYHSPFRFGIRMGI